MHSLAMAQDILEAALSEAEKRDAKHIKTISVKTGDKHCIESDSLQFCLEASTKGTIAEGAQIEVEPASITTKCPECLLVFPIEDQSPICPRCGNSNPEILTGEEPLQIELELE
ncbi:hydrogenase maturation nickel metallochaperone HypA [Chloroflexota bacterium]